MKDYYFLFGLLDSLELGMLTFPFNGICIEVEDYNWSYHAIFSNTRLRNIQYYARLFTIFQ